MKRNFLSRGVVSLSLSGAVSVCLFFAACSNSESVSTSVVPEESKAQSEDSKATAEDSLPAVNTKIAGSEWLFGVEYDENDDFDYETLSKEAMFLFSQGASQACTEVRQGDLVGRNFDGAVGVNATTVIKVDAIPGKRFASLAVGGVLPLTRDLANAGIYHMLYKYVPLSVMDGINENGVFAAINLIPAGETSLNPSTWEYHKFGMGANYTNPEAPIMITTAALPRYVLDKATSVDHALELIKQVNWKDIVAKTAELGEKPSQYMIADSVKTSVVTFLDNKMYVVISQQVDKKTDALEDKYANLMTNFSNYFTYVQKRDGKTPIYQNHGSGVERLEDAYAHYGEYTTVDKMFNELERTWYGNLYEFGMIGENSRITDIFDGIPDMNDDPVTPLDINVVLADTNFAKTPYAQMVWAAYKKAEATDSMYYSPNSKVFYTIHSSVYEISKRKLHLHLHQGRDGETKTHEFTLDAEFGKPMKWAEGEK